MTPFLERHRGSLRQLRMGGNFLEKKFIGLLVKNKLMLKELKINSIFFTIEEF